MVVRTDSFSNHIGGDTNSLILSKRKREEKAPLKLVNSDREDEPEVITERLLKRNNPQKKSRKKRD